jgi:hypothetical protein
MMIQKKNDGGKVMLGIICVLIVMFLGACLMIYDLRRDNKSLQEQIWLTKVEVDTNVIFINAIQNKQKENYSELNNLHSQQHEQIILLEESIDPKNFRWARIKRVRDVIVKESIADLTIVEFTTIAGAIVDYTEENNVSIPLVLAVMKAESAFNPKAVSHAGALGLMQVMPKTAENISPEVGRRRYSLFNSKHNIQFGTYYLWKMLNRFDEDVELAVKAYNCGPIYVERIISGEYKNYPEETVGYSEKVLKYKEEFDKVGF